MFFAHVISFSQNGHRITWNLYTGTILNRRFLWHGSLSRALSNRALLSNLTVFKNTSGSFFCRFSGKSTQMDERLRRIRGLQNETASNSLPQAKTFCRIPSTSVKAKKATKRKKAKFQRCTGTVNSHAVINNNAVHRVLLGNIKTAASTEKCRGSQKFVLSSSKVAKMYSHLSTSKIEKIDSSDDSNLLLVEAAECDISSQIEDQTVAFNYAPKQYLLDLFAQIGKSFCSCTHKLNSPTFAALNPHTWACTYDILWPQSIRFTSQGFSKNDAAHNTARTALKWLVQNNHMDNFGQPWMNHGLLKVRENMRFKSHTCNYCASSNTEVDVTKMETISLGNENQQINHDEIKRIRSLYPLPKSTLHSCFQILSTELKRPDLKLIPTYKLQKNLWNCTYNLKWPEAMKFLGTGRSKQEASQKAVMMALTWLIRNKKINKEGKPIVYDAEERKKILSRSYGPLKLTQFVEEKLCRIVDYYKSDLVTQLVDECKAFRDNEGELTEELETKWPEMYNFNQKFMGVSFYEAKEPVKLPISDFRYEITESSKNNRVLIIKGEPGCGKSTRVPQYILEAWAKNYNGQPCRIIVTQPRRVAAISLAERVADEQKEAVGITIGYNVRFNSNFNQQTGRIMYCTTGILLRRLQVDPRLSDCTHVILDEAHERDVNTDLLMNLVKHAMNHNPILKILIMSATIEAKLFQDYFDDAPILNIPGFTYPVQQHFLNSNTLVKTYQMCKTENPVVVHEDVVKIIGHIHKDKPEGAILCFLPGWDDIMKVSKLIPQRNDVEVLCLHSKLQMSEQQKIFRRPPAGVRKIILATNIAETSITIDDVVYVVDTGIHKEQRFDVDKGVNCMDNYWISQASATQRKGRAGRCQPGECFHLYPESKCKELEPQSIPEILRTCLTKIVLDSKVYSNNMKTVEFLNQLICPPDRNSVERAIEELTELELLDENENLTPLGRTLSNFQLPPKLSKAMVNSVIFKCVTPIVDIATLFSSDSAIFAKTLNGLTEIKRLKKRFSGNSDHLAMMRMFEEWLNLMDDNCVKEARNLCDRLGLVFYKMCTMEKLRELHFGYLSNGLQNTLPLTNDFSDNDEMVKAVLLSGVGNVLQHRNWDFVKGRLKKSNVFLTKRNQKTTITSESVNSRRDKFGTNFLLYINETMSNLRHTMLVRETSEVSPLTVLLFKSGELDIEQIPKQQHSDTIESEDQVLLRLQGTTIAFVCERRHASAIRECKKALSACKDYYIYQLTKGGDCSKAVQTCWSKILQNLSDILNAQELNDNLDDP